MKTNERASQIWFALVAAAADTRTVTYKEAATWTGTSAQSMGQFLRPIQSYCESKQLPDISAIVVNVGTGQPSPGHGKADDVPTKQRAVFGHDWLRTRAPVPEDFSQT